MWPSPVDVGEVPRVTNPAERVAASVVHEGIARVELGHGIVGRAAGAVEIDESGALHWVSR